MLIRNLSVLSYAQGYTAWHYKGHGLPLATALAENFFSPACDLMKQGDTVLVSTTTGGALLFLQAVDKVEKSSTTVLMCRTPSIYGGSAV